MRRLIFENTCTKTSQHVSLVTPLALLVLLTGPNNPNI